MRFPLPWKRLAYLRSINICFIALFTDPLQLSQPAAYTNPPSPPLPFL